MPSAWALSQLLPSLDAHVLTALPRPHFSGLPGPFTSITGTRLPHSHLKYFSSLFVCLLCNQVLYDPNQLALCYRINLLAFISSCLCAHTMVLMLCMYSYPSVFEYTQLHFHYTFISPHIEFASSLLTLGLFVSLRFLTQGHLSSSCITLLLKDPLVGKWLQSLQHSALNFNVHLSFQLLPRNFFFSKIFSLTNIHLFGCGGSSLSCGFLFWHTLWSCCAGSVAQGMQELSSLTRDRAHSPGSHSGLLATEPWKSRFPRLYHPTSFLAALLLLPLQQARMLRKLPSPTASCLNHNQPPGHVLLMEDEP